MCEYGTPTLPFGNPVGPGLILYNVLKEIMTSSSPHSFEALIPTLLNSLPLVSVPEITPVLVFRLSPLGKLPYVMLQVIGAVPVALSV